MSAVNVFYSDSMVADSRCFSPSAGKPVLAVESWKQRFDINVLSPEPVSIGQLVAVHDRDYVSGVLDGTRSNGFGNRSPEVAASLLYTSGAMLAATCDAIDSGGFSCAPVSGFHHAGYSHGGGYCTFNGLMVSAMDVLDDGLVSKVGILDCDMHYGNGTDDILYELGEDRVVHFTVGKTNVSAEKFLMALANLIESLFHDCGVLIYQAGADPHVDDPLGGWMTTEQLLERDRIVFSACRNMGLPCAWDLAGGYQRDKDGGISRVLEIHDNTMMACIESLS